MNLVIKQNNQNKETVLDNSIVEKLYNLTKEDVANGITAIATVPSGGLQGWIEVDAAYEDSVSYLNAKFGPNLQIDALSYYIRFYDPNIVDFLVSKGVMQAGQGITTEQAKTATVGQGVDTAYFFRDSGISSFDEFKYFTKFNTERWSQMFCNCSLESVDLTNVKVAWWLQFGWAPNLKYFNGRDSEEGSLSLPHFEEFKSSNAFEGDTGIKKLLSLGSCTVLGITAFRSCTNLTTIHQTICNQLTIIKDSGFKNCPIVNFIQNDETVTHVLSLPNLITLENNAFARDNTNTTSFTEIASLGVISVIEEYAFKNCTNLLTINFPNTISEIGIGAFQGTAWLAAQNNGPIIINNKVLYKYKGNTGGAYSVPSDVVSITGEAFADDTTLTSLSIPSNVSKIGDGAFTGCSGLTSVTINAATPPTLGTNAFQDTNNCPIYVPPGSVSAYQSASGWSTYAGRIQAIQT